ncbi:hypothetical protein MRX96_041572 [Rhipicephalus microplus]
MQRKVCVSPFFSGECKGFFASQSSGPVRGCCKEFKSQKGPDAAKHYAGQDERKENFGELARILPVPVKYLPRWRADSTRLHIRQRLAVLRADYILKHLFVTPQDAEQGNQCGYTIIHVPITAKRFRLAVRAAETASKQKHFVGLSARPNGHENEAKS